MEELIKQAFLHVDLIGPHVQEGHYDLIGPNGEIILPSVWEKVIEPDWSVTMHMWPMDKIPLRGHVPGRPGVPLGAHHDPRHRMAHMASMRAGMRPSSVRPSGGAPPPPPTAWGGRAAMAAGGELRRHPVATPVDDHRKKSSKSGSSMLGWMAGSKSKSSGSSSSKK
jgi:hypothetical protein